jgi:hypothetical protein
MSGRYALITVGSASAPIAPALRKPTALKVTGG